LCCIFCSISRLPIGSDRRSILIGPRVMFFSEQRCSTSEAFIVVIAYGEDGIAGLCPMSLAFSTAIDKYE
jgi:hypothetical protein